ncbi:gp16 family protein [Candidatus Binatus sp.]|jgi:phage gp16-like protein|uniref:gp16 family protein n=1 Tax=Candidatus Binatus sp. TaxID=2811406 RepID=UPI003CAE1AA2
MKAGAQSSPAIARGRRNAELAAIHVAVKQLGLDDSTYRALLFATTGHRSAAELDDGQRQQVIELLRSRGFKRTPAEEKRARRMADNRQLAMIRGLWKKLHYAGALSNPSDRHLSAFVKKLTGIERAEWLAPEEAIKVIEVLKGWLARVVAKAPEPGR